MKTNLLLVISWLMASLIGVQHSAAVTLASVSEQRPRADQSLPVMRNIMVVTALDAASGLPFRSR